MLFVFTAPCRIILSKNEPARRMARFSIEAYASVFERKVADDTVTRFLSFGSRPGIGRSRWAGPPILEAAAPCREGASYAKHRHLRDRY
ncbi:hypothetical protein GCM10007857_81600 [Bradyrhizobium iriomotense]|uniref:Uncharacterized protein n=1 Tax=Bradyrhizobium iriomotense TaxID=441950 RepID=A0ABQ6BCD4_9BRAD|nr:hypothetical protein GCM10007857_81600 [Bradyrhizobium iriomotense]